MSRLLTVLIATSAVSAPIAAAPSGGIALFGRAGIGARDNHVAVVLESMKAPLIKHGASLVERERIDKILEEQGLQRSGCVDDACPIRIGKLVQAAFIVQLVISVRAHRGKELVRIQGNVTSAENGTSVAIPGSGFFDPFAEESYDKIASAILIGPNEQTACLRTLDAMESGFRQTKEGVLKMRYADERRDEWDAYLRRFAASLPCARHDADLGRDDELRDAAGREREAWQRQVAQRWYHKFVGFGLWDVTSGRPAGESDVRVMADCPRERITRVLQLNVFGCITELYGLGFGLVGNSAEATNGIQVSLLGNDANSLRGVQIAGVLNQSGASIFRSRNPSTGASVQGLQVSGLMNWAYDMSGVQLAGFINADHGSFTGLQLVLGFNLVRRNLHGVQMGVGNIATDVRGTQVGLVNRAEWKLGGAQIAGFANLARDVRGLQVAVLANGAEILGGMQLGTYNHADRLHSPAVQMGLVNNARTPSTGYAGFSLSLQFGAVNLARQNTGSMVGIVNYCTERCRLQVGLLNIAWGNPIPVLPILNVDWRR